MYIPDFNLCHANSSCPGFPTCLLSHSSIICVVVIIGGFSKTRLLNRFCAILLHCICYNGNGNNHLHLCAENCVDLSYFSVMVVDVLWWCSFKLFTGVISRISHKLKKIIHFPPTLSLVHRWIGRCSHPCSATPPTTRGGALAMHTGNANFCWMGGDAPACNFSNNIFRTSSREPFLIFGSGKVPKPL